LLIIAAIAPLPFVFYGIALSIVFFPRYVLTRHFWTENQKQKFWQHFFDNSYKPRLQRLADFACPKYAKSVPLSGGDLAGVEMPDLNELDVKHLFHLFRLHNISLFTGTNGLKKHARFLAQLDAVMAEDRESIERLTDIQLKNHLYIRRLDFKDKSAEEMRESLHDWIANLKSLSNAPTVYLHAPILLQATTKPGP